MSAVRSPEGAFTGSMRTKRIDTLLQAYRTTTSSELGDSPQMIAELVARYKDGSKSGAHNVAYKSCYTAPPSLTTALISALGATAVLFSNCATYAFPLQQSKHWICWFLLASSRESIFLTSSVFEGLNSVSSSVLRSLMSSSISDLAALWDFYGCSDSCC